MVTNFFTLQALSLELHAALQGMVIREVFTQRKNELLIVYGCPDVAESAGVLCVSIGPGWNYLVLRSRISRAKRNCVDLFSMVVGATITAVEMQTSDRLVAMTIGDRWRLLFQLYNTASGNLILVDRENVVLESFKRNRELLGTCVAQTRPKPDSLVPTDVSILHERLRVQNGAMVSSALRSLVPQFGTLGVCEVLFRCGILESELVDKLDGIAVARLHKELHRMVGEVAHPTPTIYHRGDQERILSVVPLHHLDGYESERFITVNAAIVNFLAGQFHSRAFGEKKRELLERIGTDLQRSRRALEKMILHISNEPDRNEQIGKLLLAHLADLEKGMTEVVLAEVTPGAKEERISLDPRLTPVQNAERYFKKAKDRKAKQSESARRTDELTSRVNTLVHLEDALGRCKSTDDLREFISSRSHELSALKLMVSDAAKKELPFRVFTVAGGFEVWVGKSSTNNDELTSRYAKADDLWFHARGASGSHAVLKLQNRRGTVPREAIQQAAAIAAYYSKMRNASMVPVAYCERKYVRKPKGAPAGTVHLEREEVTFVRPHLP